MREREIERESGREGERGMERKTSQTLKSGLFFFLPKVPASSSKDI